jgi:hypothetical protein
MGWVYNTYVYGCGASWLKGSTGGMKREKLLFYQLGFKAQNKIKKVFLAQSKGKTQL